MPRRTNVKLERRHLEAIVAVGRASSVHSAARQLGLAQPALSRRIVEAERLLGTQLFDRSHIGSHLTAAGAAVLRQAEFTLRAFAGLTETATLRPVVRLGCVARAMYLLMPRVLELLVDHSPSFALRITENPSAALLAGLLDARLDVAVSQRTPTVDVDRFAVELLYNELTVIICGHSNKAVPERVADLRELRALPWVLPNLESDSRRITDRAFIAAGLAPVMPVIETRSFDSDLALVAATRMISIAPESVAHRYQEAGLVRIVRTKQVLDASPVMLVYPKLSLERPEVAAFRELTLASAKDARRLLS